MNVNAPVEQDRRNELDAPPRPGDAAQSPLDVNRSNETGPPDSQAEDASPLYRLMVDRLPEAAALLARDGRILHANERLAGLLRLQRAELVGRPLALHLPVADRPVLDRALADGQGRGEYALAPKGVPAIPVYLSLTPVDPGRNGALLLVAIDLIRQKHDEKAFAGDRLSRTILENTTEVIIVCDRSRRIIQASQTARRLCDGEPVGRLFREAFPLRLSIAPPDAISFVQFKQVRRKDELGCLLRSAMEGRILQGIEARLVRGDGSTHDFILSAGPFCNARHEVEGCVLSLTDITQRKQSERALRDSETRLRLALEATGMGTWETFNNKVIWSHRFKEIVGLPPEAEVAPDQFEKLLHPDDLQYACEVSARARDPRGDGRYNAEYRIIRPDGEVRWLHAMGQCLRMTGDQGQTLYRFVGTMRDITEAKQAEAALRDSETRLRLALEATGMGTWETDEFTDQIHWSDRCKEIFGFPPDAVIVKGQSARLVHPEDAERIREHIQQAREPGSNGTINMKCRIIRPDGEMRWIHVMGQGQRYPVNEQQTGLRFVGTVRDITAGRLAEAALRENEARLRLALGATGMGTWETDSFTGKANWSERCKEIFGLPPETKILPMHFERLVHPDDLPRVLEALARARDPESGGAYRADYRIVRPDGVVRWVQSMGQGEFRVLDDGRQAVRFVGTILDITDRKLAEEALRENERHFRLIAEALPQIVWTANPAGTIDYINERLAVYSGVDLAKLLDWGWKSIVHPEDIAPCVAQWRVALGSGDPYQFEHRVRRTDGQYRWHLVRAFPLRDKDGLIFKWFGTSTDIDDQKRAEERMRTLNESLEKRVEERTQTLVHKQRQLRALTSELTLAEQRERRRLATELHDYLAQLLVVCKIKLAHLRKMTRSARMTALIGETTEQIDNSIKYTRTLVAELSPVILYEAGLGAALNWLAEQMRRHGLDVDVRQDGPAAQLPDDQAWLVFQAIRELLFNVVKHAHVSKAVVHIQETILGNLVITVSDEGKGFDPAARGADPAVTGKFGLFNIRERLEAMGGWLEIFSLPGRGTRATLAVPLRPAEVAGETAVGQAPAPDHAPPARRARRKARRPVISVLIVDDHALVRDGLRSVLDTYTDLRVIGEASDGEQAVELARALRPDVILMDINLPRLNGIEATRRIRVHQPDAAIVGLSMHEDREMISSIVEAGACAYLSKSGPSEELIRAIRGAVKAKVLQ